MAYEWGPRHIESYAAGADLSSAQYRIGVLGTNRTVTVASVVGTGTGVIDNANKQGLTIGLVTDGTTKVLLNGTVAVGDPLIADATGAAIKRVAQTGVTVFGTAREAGVAGQIIAARVDFSGAGNY